jgi:hypothetical protein
MTINEYFDSCPYLISFKKADKYNIMEAKIKTTWKVPTNKTIKYNPRDKNEDNYVIGWFFSETDSFDDIFSWFIGEVVKKNIEIEEKEKLLKEKVLELKNIFNTKSLEDLKDLSFDIGISMSNEVISNNSDIEEEGKDGVA